MADLAPTEPPGSDDLTPIRLVSGDYNPPRPRGVIFLRFRDIKTVEVIPFDQTSSSYSLVTLYDGTSYRVPTDEIRKKLPKARINTKLYNELVKWS